MTEEEIRKAMEEGTWLVAYNKYLARADRLWRFADVWGTGPPQAADFMCYAKNLRVATPNDMLKYGE